MSEHNDDPRPVLRSPRLWLAPAVVVTALMALLAAMYLGGVLDPQQHLHGFPVALVDQDEGETVAGQPRNVGHEIADGIADRIPADKIDLRRIGIAEATDQLQHGEVYGAIVIPSDFSKRLMILGQASVVPGDVERPVITVQLNPRMGAYAQAITLRIAEQALEQVNDMVGKQLTEQVRAELAKGEQPPTLSGASQLTLAQPVDVRQVSFHPLPDGTGNGLSAFFYTIMLVLAGFTGSMIVHQLVDSRLGFAPTEFGPWYVRYPSVGISRFRTLLVKWGIIAGVAPVVSGIYLGIARLLGMPVDRPLALFLYSTLAIISVGVTALTVLAALGSAGMLVNLVVFIVAGLPASGGSVPIEATPPLFGLLARVEPMHQVFLGVRSILYFNATGAGLASAIWMAILGLGIGLAAGAAVTRFYDRKGLLRQASPASA
ncbi:YhgE/Pip domain-containing protein [Skermania piniformis]|nr:ABC transporter permease [Skermania piniformis]